MFQGREVTLMLAIASAGLTFPLERTKMPSHKNTPHPSNDRQTYQVAATQIETLKEGSFLGSALWTENPGSWCSGKLRNAKGAPDDWPEMAKPKIVRTEKTTGAILDHLRNALAHGNIYAEGDPIKRIIFLSEAARNTGVFKYLLVSPSDFLKFMQNWFVFISTLELPDGLAVGTDEDVDHEQVKLSVTASC